MLVIGLGFVWHLIVHKTVAESKLFFYGRRNILHVRLVWELDSTLWLPKRSKKLLVFFDSVKIFQVWDINSISEQLLSLMVRRLVLHGIEYILLSIGILIKKVIQPLIILGVSHILFQPLPWTQSIRWPIRCWENRLQIPTSGRCISHII